MCEYCDGNKMLIDNFDPQDGTELSISNCKLSLEVWTGGQSAADESLPINYCPVCGRKLNK